MMLKNGRDVLLESGIGYFTVTDVAKRCGCTLQTIENNYGNKWQFLCAIGRRYYKSVGAKYPELLKK